MIEKVVNESINVQLATLRATSLNIANVTTPGHLRQTSFTQVIEDEIVSSTQIATSQLNGSIRQTENDLDFAVLESALFVVEHQGTLMVTQDGRFHKDENGQLRHISGAIAMTENGPITPEGKPEELAKQMWTVSTEQQHVELIADSSGLYKPDWSEWNSNKSSRVINKALNQTSHDTTADVVEMMQTQRSIESIQKAYQAYDAAMSYGITELGRR